jgi:hypothetical protein
MQHRPINAHRKDRDQPENTGLPIAARCFWRQSRDGRAGKGRQTLSVQQLLGPKRKSRKRDRQSGIAIASLTPDRGASPSTPKEEMCP